MNSTTFTLYSGERLIKETVTPGKTLLQMIQSIPSVDIDAPCGGKGSCGKCRVQILEGSVSAPDTEELRLLSSDELTRGIRLACRTVPEGSVSVRMITGTQGAIIKESGGLPFKGKPDSLLARFTVTLPEGSLEDQRSFEQRLLDSLPEKMTMDHKTRSLLAALQKDGTRSLEISRCGSEICSITPLAEEADGDFTSKGPFALAVDIGTTTVVAYLLDLEKGETIGSASALNSQKAFGADVISRIEYIGGKDERLKELQSRIVFQIEALCKKVLKKTRRNTEDLLGIFAAGNTTMMHILQGLSPQSLAEAPFLPVSTETMILKPGDLGSNLPSSMRYILLPSLSAYIGADIIAGILSTEMAESDDLCLLVDIGTNGEIALGNREKMTSCSTAAGPAFEGANIRCGSAGIPGAVSAVSGLGSSFSWETIGGGEMTGICGSGIIDLTAYLLKSGLADYTGRIQDESDWGENAPEGSEFLKEIDDEIRFVWGDERAQLFFSQRDLREVQLAKGSIAAGINTLIKDSGASMDDIKHVYLAGGFGSYINTDSALAVGLLPEELKGKIRSVGNSCGGGVIRCALSREELQKTEEIRKNCGYVELSSHAGFQEEYMMSMYFPETER